MSHRLFVALRPSDSIIDAMMDCMGGIKNARWMDETQIHLTLRFIGEVDTPLANDIADALGTIHAPAFELMFRDVGMFERGHWPSAIWAGVEHSPELLTLRKKVERAIVTTGVAPETRRFTPHVTLARLNRSAGDPGAWLVSHGDFSAGPIRIDHFTLYESTLTQDGPHYEPVMRFNLA